MTKSFKTIVFVIGLGILLTGCADTKSDPNQVEIQFLLTDMPGEYQQVNIDIAAVNVIVNDSLIELTTIQGIYNLLEFVNGKDTLLVDDAVPTGFISQVRLILGENNTIMIDSAVYDLKTPSAQQSGLKLNVHNEFIPGESYSYVIDFVVEKSIVKTGNGKYILKPVIRIFTESVTGSVQGVVTPAEAKPYIMVVLENDTNGTYADSVTGNYMIRGLPEGIYTIEFQPVEDFKDTVLTDINVVNGQITVIDTIRFK